MMKKTHNPDSQADDTPLGNRVHRPESNVKAMSKFNIQAAINKSIKAHLKQIKLPKGILDFKKIKLEKTKRKGDDHDKDQARSSNKGKSSSKPSKSNKPIDADEVIQDEETDTGECVKVTVRDSSPTAPAINKTKPIGIPIEVGNPFTNVAKPFFGDNQDEGSIGTQNQNAANLEIVEVEDNATQQSRDGESGNSLKPNDKRKKKDAPKRENPKKIDPFVSDMTGKMLTNESRIMARDFSKIEDENNRDVEGSQAVKDLRFESVRLPKELVVLRDVARSLEDSHKVLAKEVERLHPFVEEVEWLHQKFRSFEKEKDTFLSTKASLCNKVDALSSRLKVVDLEWVGLVKEFFPLVVKKLMASDHFNLVMADM
nr:hypothetical protein [Tanacetum cinerariifolium]